MKQIMLLRHAKSSRDDTGLRDFDRPLAKRGREDAARIGGFLKQTGFIPAHIISSPAQRAKETLELLSGIAEMDEGMAEWNEDLYRGTYHDYLEAISDTPDSVVRILMVGHNPKLEEVADALCGFESGASIRISPATLVWLEHPADSWKQVRPGTARIKWVLTPEVIENIL